MKHQGTVELETDRLFLRRLSEADANEMFKNCYSINSLNLTKFNTSYASTYEHMS